MANPYFLLLRDNRTYRNLFFARAVSLMGDWFNTIAVFVVLDELTQHTTQAFGWVLIIKVLPYALLAGPAGVVADRYDKTKVMMASDVSRFVVSLGLLLVHFIPHAGIIYFFLILQTALGTFFEPARTALLPAIVKRQDLVTANALGAITWSVMLTMGSAIGGIMAEHWGWDVVVIINALSYLVSAWFIKAIYYQEETIVSQRVVIRHATGITDLKEGLQYLVGKPRLLILASIKGAFCIGGAVSLIHAVFGEQVYQLGDTAALGISYLYAARGLGTALGPIFARRLTRGSPRLMRLAILCGFILSATAYVLFGACSSLSLALLLIVLGHMGGSTVWVFSTVLLHFEISEQFRGRVFGYELGVFTLSSALSTLCYSNLIEFGVLSPHGAATLLGALWLLPAALWFIAMSLWKNDRQ